MLFINTWAGQCGRLGLGRLLGFSLLLNGGPGVWHSIHRPLLTCNCRHTSMGLVRSACSRFILPSPFLSLCTIHGKGVHGGGAERRSGCSAARVVRKTSLLCCQMPRPSSAQAPVVCVCVCVSYVHKSEVSFRRPQACLSEASRAPLACPNGRRPQRPQGTKTTEGADANRFSKASVGISGGFCADPWRRGGLRPVSNLARFESKTRGRFAPPAGDRGGLAPAHDRPKPKATKRPSESSQCPPWKRSPTPPIDAPSTLLSDVLGYLGRLMDAGVQKGGLEVQSAQSVFPPPRPPCCSNRQADDAQTHTTRLDADRIESFEPADRRRL